MSSSSIFASLGSALLPSRRPSSPPQFHCPELAAFESSCSSQLEQMKRSPEEFMSSAWLCQALNVVLRTHASMEAFVPDLQRALAAGDTKWLNSYLGDSAKLLDACNALRVAIADMREYQDGLDVALRSFEGGKAGPSQELRAAQRALSRCAGALKKGGRWRLDKCSSGLRKMGEKLSATQQHQHQHQPYSSFFAASCAAQLTTVFICGVVASALSGRPLPLQGFSTGRPRAAWASSFASLQRSVKELTEKKTGKGASALLAELESADAEACALDECISEAIREMGACKAAPLRAVDVRTHLGRLRACSYELLEGLTTLDAHIAKLYKVLVATRMALLDMYSSCRG